MFLFLSHIVVRLYFSVQVTAHQKFCHPRLCTEEHWQAFFPQQNGHGKRLQLIPVGKKVWTPTRSYYLNILFYLSPLSWQPLSMTGTY
jgi:hypothetical protein